MKIDFEDFKKFMDSLYEENRQKQLYDNRIAKLNKIIKIINNEPKCDL
jgi:hypothetical protein